MLADDQPPQPPQTPNHHWPNGLVMAIIMRIWWSDRQLGWRSSQTQNGSSSPACDGQTVTPVTPVTDSKSAQNSQEHKTTIRDYPKVQFRCFQTQMNTNIKAQTLWINDPKLCFDLLQILSSLILNKNIYNHSYAARPNWLDSNHLIPYMFWSIIKSLIHNQKAMHWRALFMLNENKKFTICLDSSQRQNIMGSDRIRKPVYAKRWSKIIWDQF
jgi:hypothetical protein